MEAAEKDYYLILGVEECASRAEIDKQYRREAAKHHPDRGGNEERMKWLNEAYGVLKDESSRKSYDEQRRTPPSPLFVRESTPTAQDVGVLGHCLSATLCLSAGVFLLLLVRFQWIWFLWPLVILAVFVILFGIILTRGALRAIDRSLPHSNPLRGHTALVEVVFWAVLGCSGYAIYLVLAQ